MDTARASSTSAARTERIESTSRRNVSHMSYCTRTVQVRNTLLYEYITLCVMITLYITVQFTKLHLCTRTVVFRNLAETVQLTFVQLSKECTS